MKKLIKCVQALAVTAAMALGPSQVMALAASSQAILTYVDNYTSWVTDAYQTYFGFVDSAGVNAWVRVYERNNALIGGNVTAFYLGRNEVYYCFYGYRYGFSASHPDYAWCH